MLKEKIFIQDVRVLTFIRHLFFKNSIAAIDVHCHQYYQNDYYKCRNMVAVLCILAIFCSSFHPRERDLWLSFKVYFLFP